MAGTARKRNKSDNSANNGEGDGSKPAAAKSKAPNGGGMTCTNWFFVLFLICGVAGGVSCFAYIKLDEVMQQQLQQHSKSLDISRIGGQLESMEKKLASIEEMKVVMTTIKENEAASAAKIEQLSSQIKKSQQASKDSSSKLDQSLQSVEAVKKEIVALKSTHSTSSEETEASLRKITDNVAASNSKIGILSKEVSDFDKRLNTYFEQTASIQKETIDLTADKVAMNSAIESMKTTIVMVRDKLNKLQAGTSGGEAAGDVQRKIEELDAKMTEEITRLARQLAETSENSATWLQQSTNEMSNKFQRGIEDLAKQFNEVKVRVQEPTQASADESVVNSIASVNTKLDEMTQVVDVVKKSIEAVEKKQTTTEEDLAAEFEEERDSLVKLTARVMEVKGRDEKMEVAMDTLTKQVTSLTNELNGVKTTARILETRMEEIRTNKASQPPQPAAAPDQPTA